MIKYDVEQSNGGKYKLIHSGIDGKELKKKYKEFKSNNGLKTKYKIYKYTKKGKSLYKELNYDIFTALKNIKINFYYYSVECDYETYYNCDRSYCDTICRCSKIVDPKIKSFDVNDIIDKIKDEVWKVVQNYKLTLSKDILLYCVDRLVNLMNINEDSFNIQVCRGYYGEEFDGVYLEEFGGLINNVCLIIDKTNLEAIQFVLMAEYGHLLDCVKSSKIAKVVSANFEDLVVTNKEYYKKLNKDIIEKYKDKEMILGIYQKDGDKFKLIDGYHRYCANQDIKNCQIIALE